MSMVKYRVNGTAVTSPNGKNGAPAPTDRQPNGTFAPGNPGGPGRPKRQTETAYMAAIMAACTLETWQVIVERAVTDAKNGDSRAREWLARYLIGEPDPESYAPKPSRVIAQEEAGTNEIDDEVNRLKWERAKQGLPRLAGKEPA